MHDEHPHPLLAQVPLTVSPFLSLPTPTPLPYTYKSLPSTLPPSILSTFTSTSNPTQQNRNPNQSTAEDPNQNNQNHPAYITSSTGQTATPDTILQSCLALQQHLAQLEASARQTLQRWEDERKARDLAEKRRVAPGWLDGDVRLLVPENVDEGQGGGGGGNQGDGDVNMDMDMEGRQQERRRTSVGIKRIVERRGGMPDERAGEELDRAFGGMDIR